MATPTEQLLIQIAQSLGETNARIRKMQDGDGEIHAFYREANRLVAAYDGKRAFGLRPASITWKNTISVAGTASVSKDIKLAENEDFIVSELRGLLNFNDWSAEVALSAALGTNVSPRDRVALKAFNTSINLQNLDSKVAITDTDDLSLASFLPSIGAMPIRYGGEGRPAWIIPHGQAIRMKATLNNTTAAYIGGSTDYGCTASGVFISRTTR